MKTKKIELLSPAKDVEVGMAAINHGADAVYIGGPDFGAREKASNSIEDIERLCRHAALYDTKVYVTLNTLLYERELERARVIAFDCWNAGVDALIVQDMALLQLDLPPIPLHASTQCDNMTVEKVQLLESLGFSQVVLGRELSLKQIREIREKTSVPLEFFVHGSLCVSHSGRCYLSQYIGNRSANRGACAQPCRLPWDLLDADGKVLIRNRHLLSLKDLNNSAHLEELIDAGITSFKIEGRMKDADYVKNITAYYRQKLDEILNRRNDLEQASCGRICRETMHRTSSFEVNPEKSFNRGFTDFFINGRQKDIGAPFTPKSMGEYIGEVNWCNPLRMEIQTDKTLHNGDGLCFLNQDNELQGLRADVVNIGRDGVHTVSTNRPHGAYRGAKIYRNLDLEWQKQVEASSGNRKIDIDLVLSETETGYEMTALCRDAIHRVSLTKHRASLAMNHRDTMNRVSTSVCCDRITATNPEKATENIRKKALQWGDTVFHPVNLEMQFAEPRLIPASVIGEMKRDLVLKLTQELIDNHQNNRPHRDVSRNVSKDDTLSCSGDVSGNVSTDPDTIPAHLMTCHHCIRYANGMCSKENGQKALPLFIRNGDNTFRLDFDCLNCVMTVSTLNA